MGVAWSPAWGVIRATTAGTPPDAGQVMRVGSPRALYERPANNFVAQFLGGPTMNILPARVADGRLTLPGGRADLALPADWAGAASVGLRAEDCAVVPADTGVLTGRVVVCEYHGSGQQLRVDTDTAGRMAAFAPGDRMFDMGDAVGLAFDGGKLHPFDANGQRLA